MRRHPEVNTHPAKSRRRLWIWLFLACLLALAIGIALQNPVLALGGILGLPFLLVLRWEAGRILRSDQSGGKKVAAIVFSGCVLGFFVLLLPISVATPKMGRIHDSANESRDRRNAQQLASVCNAAQAAGLDFVKGDSVLATVAAIVAGGTIDDPKSQFQGTFFGVPNLAEAEQERAMEFLAIANGMLIYQENE